MLIEFTISTLELTKSTSSTSSRPTRRRRRRPWERARRRHPPGSTRVALANVRELESRNARRNARDQTDVKASSG